MLDKLKSLLNKPIKLNLPTPKESLPVSLELDDKSKADNKYSSSHFNNYSVTYIKEGSTLTTDYSVRKTTTFNPSRFLLSIGEDPSADPSPIEILDVKLISEK